MVIDVASILKEFGGKISIDGNAGISDLNFGGSDYHFENPVSVKGSVTNTGTALILDADCAGVMTTRCARCMKEIEAPAEFKLSETLMQGEENVPDDEDIIVFDGHVVNLDEIIENNFIMNLSPRYLCREDCKGLCPKCGADLNEGECSCKDDDIDPRWAALAKMIQKED